MKTIMLGKVAGLMISAKPNAAIGFVILWAVLSLAGLFALKLPPLESLLGGLAATLLHFFSEMWHQYGHAIAARSTGYPMKGMRFWWVLAASIYPSDEPELPARTHIRRAMGGVPASVLLAAILTGATLALQPSGGVAWWLALFGALDNALVFTVGSLLPLGFTDGSTLLTWWGKK